MVVSGYIGRSCGGGVVGRRRRCGGWRWYECKEGRLFQGDICMVYVIPPTIVAGSTITRTVTAASLDETAARSFPHASREDASSRLSEQLQAALYAHQSACSLPPRHSLLLVVLLIESTKTMEASWITVRYAYYGRQS